MGIWQNIHNAIFGGPTPTPAPPPVVPVASPPISIYPRPVAPAPAPVPTPQPVQPAVPVAPPAAAPRPSGFDLEPLRNLIGLAEGTDAGRGYDEVIGYGKWDKANPKHKVTTMTLAECLAFGKQMVAAGAPSSALGRYQIISATLLGLINQYRIPVNTLFDETQQDILFAALLEGRGFTNWFNGKLSTSGFIDQLAYEWASLPGADGKPKYSGQGGAVTVNQVISALNACIRN